MPNKNSKVQPSSESGNAAKLLVIGSGFSIWESYTDEQLKQKLEQMRNEHEYLTDAIGKAETELFYRSNPECRRS
jgi:UDP-2,3-diacylglucosamine pyrophosphatase LpxH